ncbi:predicted protein [Botrytis cinerea T4]|uniref:Uncharacterized protein n=1 Tax=Botryotinia fuckeliana (strain T4) TaxID=999810 RepID=G2Y2D0_BOTF4|nr:predicted protein [Botrytis cinerea T4]
MPGERQSTSVTRRISNAGLPKKALILHPLTLTSYDSVLYAPSASPHLAAATWWFTSIHYA